jgi:hypothetical protein
MVAFLKMSKEIKEISFLIFAIMLNLMWANQSFNDLALLQNQICDFNECQNSSGTLKSNISICCEDDVFLNDYRLKPGIFDEMNDRVHFSNESFRSEYLNQVWQPPKF